MPNTRVHRVLEQSGSIVFPGVYDTLSARIVQRVGFPLSFISGYSVAAAGIGEPDLGLLTQTEIVERARRVCGAVKIPIIGMGGIADARDALEFIIAGASAVQVGTANFVDPYIWSKLLDGITAYMERHQVARISDLVGTVDIRTKDKEWISS